MPFTPEPQPSVAGAELDEAAEVIDAFFALIADPQVTYRVESELEMGMDGQGRPAISIRGQYDVAADAYAGRASGTAVMLESPDSDLYVLADDRETHVWDSIPNARTSVDSRAVRYRPNAVANLAPQDLVFMGRTTDGLFEFDVRPWLFDDPISTWSALGGFGDADVPPTSTESHRTRLLLDAKGVPGELRSSWTFSTEGESAAARGSLVHRFSAFGLYVSIPENIEMAQARGTSHDIVVGVDDTNTIIREPWIDVAPRPEDPSAELEVSVDYADDEPLILGIEGAISFVSSRAVDGSVGLDAVVAFEGGVLNSPPGEQTLEAYYRTCSGHCSVLDPPSTFCATDATLEAGSRYDLRVVITSATPLEADCILTLDE
jgi:hypothetical protein